MSFRPVTKEELFNLWHACARNAIEQIFSVLKLWFFILTCPPKYSMRLQARIPPALGAIHNFICIHDPDKIDEIALEEFDGVGTRELAVGPASAAERARAMAKHDRITEAMWLEYQTVLQERAHG
jgi:hypothetical protein